MSGSEWTFRNSPDDVRRADADLKADAVRHASARWKPVWDAAGIVADLVARYGEAGGIPTRAIAALTVTVPDDGRIRPEGLVALRDDDLPDASNQHLRRIEHMNRSRSRTGQVDLDLGPPLHRFEWPEVMREATVPTEHTVHVAGSAVRLVSRLGLVVSGFETVEPAVSAAHLRGVLEDFASLGRTDAREGRGGAIEIRSGRNGKDVLGRTWQLVDGDGSVMHAEPRSFLQRRPPRRVATVLAAARAGYADGLAEPRPEAVEAAAGPVPA